MSWIAEMTNSIEVLLTLPSSGNRFPRSLPYEIGPGRFVPFPTKEYQKLLQESFSAIGLSVADDFFNFGAKSYPSNLAMLALAIECRSYDIKGSIIAEMEKTGSFEFLYYNKVFVAEELWGNGLAGKMLRAMKETKMPGVLKTRSPKNDEIYSQYSDFREKIGHWHFHGFNFVDKQTKEEKFLGARSKFYAAARHIMETKPVTVHLIQDGVNYGMPLFSNQNLY